MILWIVLAGILLVFWLLGRIRIGAAVSYSEDGFFLSVKAGPVRIRVLPAKKTAKKPAKKTVKKPAAAGRTKKPGPNRRDTISAACRFLPLLGEAAGRFRRKIRIDYVKIHIIWGAVDPAAAAKGYGTGNAIMGILWPVIEHNFNVKRRDLGVDVDFERTKPELIGEAQVTITIGQSLTLALLLGGKALKIYLGIRREKAQKTEIEKAVQA